MAAPDTSFRALYLNRMFAANKNELAAAWWTRGGGHPKHE
jgi:hypothetical protein